MPDVVTVREAVQRAKADGFPISEYTLRQWIRAGEIPVRKPVNGNIQNIRQGVQLNIRYRAFLAFQ